MPWTFSKTFRAAHNSVKEKKMSQILTQTIIYNIKFQFYCLWTLELNTKHCREKYNAYAKISEMVQHTVYV